uniref:Uncharacterized protein n=1 Tax=Anguilla anguilla TaxID=7936 RepID=A0A0E9X1U5_ANGAN
MLLNVMLFTQFLIRRLFVICMCEHILQNYLGFVWCVLNLSIGFLFFTKTNWLKTNKFGNLFEYFL